MCPLRHLSSVLRQVFSHMCFQTSTYPIDILRTFSTRPLSFLNMAWTGHSTSGKTPQMLSGRQKYLHISYIHIPVSLRLIFAGLVFCFFFSFQQPAAAEKFEIHKTFLENKISQANFKCSVPHGLQAFYFKPLEALQLWKVSVPHTCMWQSRANSFETSPIFANCLRDSLVLR